MTRKRMGKGGNGEADETYAENPTPFNYQLPEFGSTEFEQSSKLRGRIVGKIS